MYKKDGLGQVQICWSFGRALHANFRRDEDSTVWHVPIDSLETFMNCESFEEAMAFLRA